ncbi:hypothetical protein [Desulfogranum japonicum]|uniref:hypothetical protein n=1 Tax=Desulfogranum japonicum TaxID=231447 RepID=UPI00048D2C2F|nr:hypothetical protein [Desulfogranum japonicum]
MSKYFSHLISRSFKHEQAEAAVRPRLPGLFEAQGMSPQSNAAEPGFVESETSSTLSSKTEGGHPFSVKPGTIGSRPERLHRFGISAQADTQPAGVKRSKMGPAETDKPSLAVPAPLFPRQDGQPADHHPTETNVQWPPAEDAPEKQFPNMANEKTPGLAYAAMGIQPAVKPTPQEQKQGPTSRQLLRKNVPIQPLDCPHPFSPPAEPAQPTIQVTIGRVEVRAVKPPAAPPQVPRPAPTPSLALDDYLKQRREGRR